MCFRVLLLQLLVLFLTLVSFSLFTQCAPIVIYPIVIVAQIVTQIRTGLRVFMRTVDDRCPQALSHPREALQAHRGRCRAHRRRYHAYVQRQVHWTSRRVGAALRDPALGKEREMWPHTPPTLCCTGLRCDWDGN